MSIQSDRREAWKKRTSEHAAALKKAKATVTLGGQRSIPLSARTPPEIRVAAWRAENPIRTIVDVSGKHTRVDTRKLSHRQQTRYNMLSSTFNRGQELSRKHQAELLNMQNRLKQMATPPQRGTTYTPVAEALDRAVYIQPTATTAEPVFKVGRFGIGEALLTKVETKAGLAGLYDIFADQTEIERLISKMEKIGIPEPSEITKKIKKGQEITTTFLEEQETAAAKFGVVGWSASKIIGAITEVNKMFTDAPRAVEMAIKEPKLIGPGVVVLATGATVGTAVHFADDPVQASIEFALMGKGLHLTQSKISSVSTRAPVKFGVETVGEYKGGYVEIKGDVHPMIGVEKGKIKFGDPTTQKPLDIKGVRPESPLQTYMIEKTIDKYFSKSDYVAFKRARDTVYETQFQVAKNGAKFTQGTKSLSPKGTKAVLDFAKRNDAEVYGSYATEAQVKPGIRRVPGDIDLNLSVLTTAEGLSLTQALLKILKAKGEKVRVSKRTPTLIESYKKGEWHHAVDLHYKVKGEYIAPETKLLGFSADKPLVAIDGIKAMGLTEQVLRKGESAVRPHEPGYLVKTKGEAFKEVGIGPEPHRIKDITDFVRYQQVLIDVMGEGVIGIFKKGKVRRAQVALEEFKAAREMFFDDVVDTTSAVKVLMQKAEPPSVYRVGVKDVSPYALRPSPAALRAVSPTISTPPSKPPSQSSLYNSYRSFYSAVSGIYNLMSVPSLYYPIPSPGIPSPKPYPITKPAPYGIPSILPSRLPPPYKITKPVIPPVPKIKPIPRPAVPREKVKTKKKTLTEAEYRAWFIKNQIPTLKQFIGF